MLQLMCQLDKLYWWTYSRTVDKSEDASHFFHYSASLVLIGKSEQVGFSISEKADMYSDILITSMVLELSIIAQ